MSLLRASIPVPPLRPQPPAWLSRRALLLWWVIGGVALLAFIGDPPVQRTQEARVLETAREMIGADWRQWMIPRLNGEPRVRKPPLTYWLAAGAFKVAGIGEEAGRIPSAVIGWLTLAATFAAAQHLFGRRAGFFAAAALLSSYLFFRHSRLAETDGPAALFVTCAIYSFIRAAGDWTILPPLSHAARDLGLFNRETTHDGNGNGSMSHDGNGNAIRRPARSAAHAGWLCAGATATGLAFFAKGGPGLFPLIFLLGLAAATRRWDLLRRFLTSGAFAFLLIGLSWYLYVVSVSGWKQFIQEMHELGSGEDHGGPFYSYFPQVLLAGLPWTALAILGIVEACRRWKSDPRQRAVLLWIAATFIPLWFIGNKQPHYLLPMMPPMMVLVGWMMANAVVPDEESFAADDPGTVSRARAVLLWTLVLAFAAVSSLPFVAKHEVHILRRADVIFTGGLLTLLAAAAWSQRAGGRLTGLVALLIGCATAMPLLIGLWYPSLVPRNTRVVARDIARFLPNGPYRFYGDNFSIPLCFNLRSEIHLVATRERLTEVALGNPGLGVIAQTKNGRGPSSLAADDNGPIRFHFITRVPGEDQAFDLYRADLSDDRPGLRAAPPAAAQPTGAGARPHAPGAQP